ncbi:MAG: UDP-N-acetylglucosamine--N-acetylmuramyl-(pentapeptide) pyrophosphoryl-undecaprenol N-acetylglucosamine transferase [Propionibacteriaceae bacterium]|nr:UDP-N-acetylglucosamine--N-acetylmuramyl-(pentapeptide) pyrophosphoryl-undecaprenol N-acetylglucosamine transferase [Propionibacteriaceae bacterium]
MTDTIDLLLAGGGTGGHTTAGAVIAAIARDLGYSVAWAARADSYEATVAAENGIRFEPVPAFRLQPKNAARVARSVVTARGLIRRWRPRLVVATGSWVCVPVAFGAKLARVPLVVHEQTLIPGSATTFLSRFARETWLTWAASAGAFHGVTVHTGFPLRPVLRQPVARADGLARFGLADAPTLFVAGGGSGAESLNAYVARHLGELLGPWQIIHQAGTSPNLTTTVTVLEQAKAALPEALRARYHVAGYLDGEHVNAALRSAALTLARAGAGFVNEVGQLGSEAVLVPYPHSVNGEQDALARELTVTGQVTVWDDADLRNDNPERLAALLHWTPLTPTGVTSPVVPTDEAVDRIAGRLTALLG